MVMAKLADLAKNLHERSQSKCSKLPIALPIATSTRDGSRSPYPMSTVIHSFEEIRDSIDVESSGRFFLIHGIMIRGGFDVFIRALSCQLASTQTVAAA